MTKHTRPEDIRFRKKEQRIGIRGNAIVIPGVGMFDPRGVREVEATRDVSNRKPYRSKTQKEEARRRAYRAKDGAWRSTAPCSYHSSTPRIA